MARSHLAWTILALGLTDSALPLLKPICHLFAVSLSSGSIPSQWCTHWITPIYKSGDKPLVSNCQPINCAYSQRYLKE